MTRTMTPILLALALLQAPATAPAKTPASSPQGYRVQKTFELGGDGGWDYLTFDVDGHRLFVSRSSHVMVVDTESGKVSGDIPETEGVHGIALAPESGHGFTSNGRAGTATMFDLKTLKTLGKVETGKNPDAILYDPFSKRVFTFNGRSSDATAIDSAEGKAVGTVELGGKPETGVSDGAGHVFVNVEDKSEIVEFDAKSLKVLAHWPVAPGEEPSGLAIDRAHHRLFAGCGNEKMVILDSESGKVIASPEIGKGVDAAAFDDATACAFASCGDGTLTVVHEKDPSTFEVLEHAKTERGARTMALDPKTHTIYLATAKFEEPKEAKEGEANQGRRRPSMVPGSFKVIVVGK
jgi:DNA-binding beta-propeller fold protein YncE